MPPLYLNHHGRPRGKPAIFSAVGFSGHGKTVYRAALLYALEQELTQAWPNFYRQALDMDTVLSVQKNLAELREGILPESTRRNFPRPSIHLLANIPKFGSKYLLAYDPPGEAFDSDEGITRYAHFVQQAKVVVFLVSLVDLTPPRETSLHRLIETYVLGMSTMKAKTKKQHLVITYTKADLLIPNLQEYPEVIQHLSDTDPARLQNPKQYLKHLQRISRQLQQFTLNNLSARSFVNLTKSQFRSVNYCAVSALGSPPEDGRLTMVMTPRCVVDPLMWVLDKS